MNETNIVRMVMLAASKFGARLWRQNSGQGWIGKATKLPNGDVLIKQARPFHAGFEGLADTGGFVPVVVTPEMVGQTIAIYLAVEVKTPTGRPSKEQSAFIRMVRSFGGRAGVARSDDDVRAICQGQIRD